MFVGGGINSEASTTSKIEMTLVNMIRPLRKEEVMNKAILIKDAYQKLGRNVRRLWKGGAVFSGTSKSANVAADRVALVARRTRYLLPPPLKK